jgi:hypothetical protein
MTKHSKSRSQLLFLILSLLPNAVQHSQSQQESPPPLRHYPVNALLTNPDIHIQKALKTNEPLAFTFDGIDQVVLMSAATYKQFHKGNLE